MKKINYLFGLVAILGLSFLLGSCGEQDPGDYNDEVLNYYTSLDHQVVQLETALWDSTYSVEDIQTEYDKTMDIYNTNFDSLKAITPLKKDPGFQAAVVAFYKGVKAGLDNEYKQILDYYNSDDIQNDDYYDKMDDLNNTVIDKIKVLEDDVVGSQQEFADAYNIDLQ